MITGLTLGNNSLISNQIYLTAFNNGSFPSTVYVRSKRGGAQGTKMPTPSFASYQFVLDFIIVGKSFADLGAQRDAFFGILGTIHSAGVQRLAITRADGSMRYLDIKAIEVTGDMKPDDATSSIVEVTLLGEYPFLQNIIPYSQSVGLSNGGGIAIPMSIPLPFSGGSTTTFTLTNKGNIAANPILTFTGLLTNPNLAITQNGVTKTLSLGLTLADSAHTCVVDCYNETVLLQPSGNVARQNMSGDFLQIPVGTSSIQLTTGSGGDTGFAIVSYADTWLNV
jgi:Phage tail protein